MLKYIFLCVALIVTPAMAGPQWFAKPVQCDIIDNVDDLMMERGQEPLFAGIGAARIGDDRAVLPVIVFANSDDDSWHVIEYNVEQDQACILAVGDNLDFNAADWYYTKND